MRLRQAFDQKVLPCPSVGSRLIFPFTIASHPCLLLRGGAGGGAGGGVDPRLIFVLRVYNQGVQEQ